MGPEGADWRPRGGMNEDWVGTGGGEDGSEGSSSMVVGIVAWDVVSVGGDS